MYKLYKFDYNLNYKIFGIDLKDESKKEGLDPDIFIEIAINETEELLKLNNSFLSQKLKDPDLQEFLKSFICLAFPFYSPYVPYDEILIENPLHSNINIIAKNVLNIFLKASKCSSNETLCNLGFSDPKFMTNLINMYGRNNEKIVNEIIKSCKMVNSKFIDQLLGVTHTLFQTLSDIYELLRSFDSLNNYKIFEQLTSGSILSDRSTGKEFDKVFVNNEHIMLDIVSILESVLKFTPQSSVSYFLRLDIKTKHGISNLEQVLTNCYYLLLYLYQLMVQTKEPIYDIKVLSTRYLRPIKGILRVFGTSTIKYDKEYMTSFQICVYYRCRIFILKILLKIVEFNILSSPTDSAEYSFNWLLIFIKMGGDQYNIDRDLIVQDFNEINFSIYVDEWNLINKNWSESEISQMKSLVVNVKDKNMEQTITKIREITEIEDEQVIINCLNKHENDIDSTIIDLIDNFTINKKTNKLATEIGKKSVEKLSISYIPTENKQAIMNYWDYINENCEMYNDDNDDEDEIPLNVNLNIDEISQSEGSEDKPTQKGRNFYRNKENHKAHYGNHHRRDR
ncbi:uncharacterized protein TA18165 [Theileria annulata]|uniref:Uncharacterized protein n=1 Tax=Theileria annulata TaxID=5874 RepID=Q4UB19_THEAN|nr:uncharacterized protein TA18165 [Theileria annulata]CAI75982.1 hypothetical protein TA18165 [Theileria annulata]|eukprot:XP_955458.1 hypothetical protein TA18165 [Theileria annulata]